MICNPGGGDPEWPGRRLIVSLILFGAENSQQFADAAILAGFNKDLSQPYLLPDDNAKIGNRRAIL